jgi:hypothetical protein
MPDSISYTEGASPEGARILFDEATVASLREGSQASDHHHNDNNDDDEERKIQLCGLEKWGIPIGASSEAPEILLLARIVWVKYKQRRHEPYLWPAIFYKNYREIAHHAPKIWSAMGFIRRLPLAATMVFDSSNPSNKTPVARLLGRADLELIQVPKDSQSEFYWELPSVLPQVACQVDYFAQDPGLYFDWHRALDEVESILRECLGNQYALTTEPSLQSWHQRAVEAEREQWQAAMKRPEALLSSCATACNTTNYYTTCGGNLEKEDLDDTEVGKSLSGINIY